MEEWTTLNEASLEDSVPTVDRKEGNRSGSLSKIDFSRPNRIPDPQPKLSEAFSMKLDAGESPRESHKLNKQHDPTGEANDFLAKVAWTETVFTKISATKLPEVDETDGIKDVSDRIKVRFIIILMQVGLPALRPTKNLRSSRVRCGRQF